MIRLIVGLLICMSLAACGKTETVTTEKKEEVSTEAVAKTATEEATTEAETQSTVTEEEKSMVQKAIEGRKLYFISPHTGDVEEYTFKENGAVEYNEYCNNEKVDITYSFTYKVNDSDNTLTLTRKNDEFTDEIKYYYISEYDYFRTEVTPSDDDDPDGMPPEFWAAGLFPFDYDGDSKALYDHWCNDLAPTFYKDYLKEDDKEMGNSEGDSIGRVTGMYGVSFVVPEGFDDVTPSEVAMKYYYEYINTSLNMTIGVSEHLKINIPSTLEDEYNHYMEFYGDQVSYSDMGTDWYVVSGVDDEGYVFYYSTKVYGDTYTGITMIYPYDNKDTCDGILQEFINNFSCN